MARLKKNDKIMKLGNRYGLSPSARLLLCGMIEKADKGFLKEGDIKNFQSLVPHFVSLFSGGLQEYYDAFQELLNSKFIEHSREEDYVFIRPYLDMHFYSILGVINSRKRQYTKSPVTIKKEWDAIYKKYGARIDFTPKPVDPDDQLIRYTTKTNGVKIPDSLRPFFTGEPITDVDGKIIARFDNNYLRQEKDRRNLTKEEKRVYYACIKFADTNGNIDDYDARSFINSILIEFGDGSVCQSTVYLALKRLIELGLVYTEIYNSDGDKGSSCIGDRIRLVVAGYKEAFNRRERYVIIPDVVLDKAFKKCPASAIKVFFTIMFRLNNGDGGEGDNSGLKKSVHLSFEKFLPRKNKQKQKEDREDWLKKRYPGEMCSIVWGDIDEVELKPLSYFFHIIPDKSENNLAFYFSIRSEFFISKSADLFKMSIALTGKNKRRAQIIEESLKHHGIDCSQEDLFDLVKIFRSAGRKNINLVIGRLADRIQLGKEKGWNDIRNIPAFVFTMYKGNKIEPEPPDISETS